MSQEENLFKEIKRSKLQILMLCVTFAGVILLHLYYGKLVLMVALTPVFILLQVMKLFKLKKELGNI